ncbi:tail fiber protein [Pelotomaculum terephthalicicum JT]|uniref:tail fiber protein n=1 Tax=Pelotomaculum terephthalicicum TaxID=206393 RepID=UPI001F04B60D|nr:tail fiber protein [Pelotomaculum terephthalicicum]MCG9967461.1 tail fiber protein [Pelotomaculum terephthalicicum JT]
MCKRIFKILITIFLLAPVMLCPFSARADAGSTPFLGEIRLFAFDFVPNDGVWVPADGQALQIAQYDALYNMLGITYGGDGMNTFAVPNLNGAGSANPWGAGKGRYFIAAYGVYPDSGTDTFDTINPYLGEIRLFMYSPATPIPKGWRQCNGDVMPVSGNTALYTLLSTAYGGDTTNFALPDLRGLEPVPGSRYCICTDGYFPFSATKETYALPTVYTGEIRLFAIRADASASTPPAGWLRCDGQSLSASAYSRLSSLLGTLYGGGGSTFNLPNLDGGANPSNPWGVTNLGTYCIVADEQYAILPSP